MRIEIIGNIASGKTTLANVLSNKCHSIYENFQENPFWESFYQAPDVYSFETEITFTLQHYHQIKRELAKKIRFVCDFSLTLDRIYADITLTGRRKEIYKQVLTELELEVGYPDTLVYLDCPEELLLERIRLRGRDTEQSISIDYLKALSAGIYHSVQEVESTKVIRIDSATLDFAHRIEDQATVKNTILLEF